VLVKAGTKAQNPAFKFMKKTFIILWSPVGSLGNYKTAFMQAESQDEAIDLFIKSHVRLEKMIIIDIGDAYKVPLDENGKVV
jgi:hypothetical protein